MLPAPLWRCQVCVVPTLPPSIPATSSGVVSDLEEAALRWFEVPRGYVTRLWRRPIFLPFVFPATRNVHKLVDNAQTDWFWNVVGISKRNRKKRTSDTTRKIICIDLHSPRHGPSKSQLHRLSVALQGQEAPHKNKKHHANTKTTKKKKRKLLELTRCNWVYSGGRR